MQIKTFLDACKKLKLDPKKVLPKLVGTPTRFQKAQIAYTKLLIIAEALNEGWQPDWNNYQEWKYWPWFYMDMPGFRFYVSYFTYSASRAPCGSRLCFRTRELSDYAGNTFLALWQDMMVIPAKKASNKKK